MNNELKKPNIANQSKVFEDMLDYLGSPPPSILLPKWVLFNKLVGGFRMREFSIVCGPSGVGKTTLLSNISAQLVEAKVKHFVMSIETGHLDYMARILSVWEGIDLNNGDPVSAKELSRITIDHFEKISSRMIEFSLYETRIDVDQLKSEIRHAVEILGCKVIFIDNLNFLLRVTRAQDAIVEMDRVVHDLIEFIKTIDCHIVMIMHPRKTEANRVTSMFDIKGSSTSVQEAQNVFLFNPPSQEALKDVRSSPFDRELFIAKMRRRGVHVGRTIVFKNNNSKYTEETSR